MPDLCTYPPFAFFSYFSSSSSSPSTFFFLPLLVPVSSLFFLSHFVFLPYVFSFRLSLVPHLLCPLLTSLLFSFFILLVFFFFFFFFLSSPPSSCLPLPLCRFHHPRKRTPKHHFAFTERPGLVQALSRNPVLGGKYSVMLATQKQCGETQRKQHCKNIDTQSSDATQSTHKKQPIPQIPFFIVFCSLHLYMTAQLLVTISTHPLKNGVSPHINTCNGHALTNTPQNAHTGMTPRIAAQMLSNTYFYRQKLTWLVG